MAPIVFDENKSKEILRQIEFYFSDSNIPLDNFLKKTVQESEDGLVNLSLICSFTRMRAYLGLGSLKPEEVPEETVLAVAEILKNSKSLRLSVDGKKIGRSTDLSKLEEVIELVDSRTISASPVPYDIQIQDMESFFREHGKVNSVRLPRHVADKRQFCGTALIEYADEEIAKKVLDEKLTYAGAELELKTKKDFDVERNKERKEVEKTRPSKTDGSNGGYPKGLIVAFKLSCKPVEQSLEQNGAAESHSDDTISKQDLSGSSEVVNENGEEAPENNGWNKESPGHLQKDNDDNVAHSLNTDGCEKTVEGLGERKASQERIEKKNTFSRDDKNTVTREDLRTLFQKFGTVKYVDFRMGEESGYIRFEDPDAAIKARAMAVMVGEGGLVVKNHIVSLEALTGEAERQYWSLLYSSQNRNKDNRSNTGRGGRDNRGRRQFHNKRPRHENPSSGRANRFR